MSTVIERLTDLQYRALDAVRSRAAFEAARGAALAPGFDGMGSARQCLVVTFKGSGDAIPTPVNFGLDDRGLLYFRSEPRSAKIRRIRRNSRVRVAPCNLRGKPTGPMADGTARVLDRAESQRADAIIAANWSAPMKALERGLDRLPIDLVYVQVTPADGDAGAG